MPTSSCIFILRHYVYLFQADCELVESLMKSVGICERLPERLLDTVTALAGSGPAFVSKYICFTCFTYALHIRFQADCELFEG